MQQAGINELSIKVKEKARELGFDIVGFARPRVLAEGKSKYQNWCDAGMNDRMGYLCRDVDSRLDPEKILPGVKTIIATGMSYWSEPGQTDPEAPVLSRYVYGEDYHEVLGKRLNSLLDYIKTLDVDIQGRAVVDSAPTTDKRWAVEAGLGWQGKHSIVINKNIGSYFFIGLLFITLQLEYDAPYAEEGCGNCRLCIDACPTGAINNDRTIDARLCISNLTIENRGPVPEDMVPKLGSRIYGCDKCQEVCPWNKKTDLPIHEEFTISNKLAKMRLADWENLSEEEFRILFENSAVRRVKYEHFMKNVTNVLKMKKG